MTVNVSFSNGGRDATLGITGELTPEESLRLCSLFPLLGRRYYHCERFQLNINANGSAFEMAPAILDEIDQLRADERSVSAKIFGFASGVPALLFAYADMGKRSMLPGASLRLFLGDIIGFSSRRKLSPLQQGIVQRLGTHSAALAHAPETALYGIVTAPQARRMGLADRMDPLSSMECSILRTPSRSNTEIDRKEHYEFATRPQIRYSASHEQAFRFSAAVRARYPCLA